MVEVTERIVPSYANKITVAQMVYDRIDPIKQEMKHDINADILSMVVMALKQPKEEGE